ncbi:amino acid ABC transporter substrate-binding protein [Desulfosarcina sp.]|uniref:amino acid ABC transporter substrate-binding protein n=1 Tax=Desulfosarcina sp. TaxID=2027861 RepID=UPI0039705B9E
MLRRTRILAVLLLLLPLSAAAAPPLPIRIGATLSLSGRYSQPAAMVRDGYRLWEMQVNQRGGLIGRPVELVILDDRSDPEIAFNQYKQLIHHDRVDLVLSPYGTPLTLQASQVSEARQMVMLACAASGNSVWDRGYRYVFGMYALAERYFIGMLDLMARQGYDTVSIIYDDSPFSIDVAEGSARWAGRFGVAVLLKKPFVPGQGQLPALIDTAAAKNAHGLIIAGYPQEGYRILELLGRTGWRPRALGMTVTPVHPDFYSQAGPIAEGIFGPSQWEPDERIPFPGTKAFILDFKTFYGRLPSYHAGSAYASCQILEQAVTSLNGINHDRIRDYISALDTVTVIGRFKVDHQGRQVGHNPIVVQWQAGKKEIVYPTKMQTAPPRF